MQSYPIRTGKAINSKSILCVVVQVSAENQAGQDGIARGVPKGT
jgi:hypothetical protein